MAGMDDQAEARRQRIEQLMLNARNPELAPGNPPVSQQAPAQTVSRASPIVEAIGQAIEDFRNRSKPAVIAERQRQANAAEAMRAAQGMRVSGPQAMPAGFVPFTQARGAAAMATRQSNLDAQAQRQQRVDQYMTNVVKSAMRMTPAQFANMMSAMPAPAKGLEGRAAITQRLLDSIDTNFAAELRQAGEDPLAIQRAYQNRDLSLERLYYEDPWASAATNNQGD